MLNSIMIYPGAIAGVLLYGIFLKYTRMFRAAHIMVGISTSFALGFLLFAFEIDDKRFIKAAFAVYGLC